MSKSQPNFLFEFPNKSTNTLNTSNTLNTLTGFERIFSILCSDGDEDIKLFEDETIIKFCEIHAKYPLNVIKYLVGIKGWLNANRLAKIKILYKDEIKVTEHEENISIYFTK